MTRTIEERIKAATADISYENRLDGDQIRAARETLRQHFAEPWLDKPDGPGNWWVKNMAGKKMVIDYQPDDALLQKLIALSPDVRWQRVIGPSE